MPQRSNDLKCRVCANLYTLGGDVETNISIRTLSIQRRGKSRSTSKRGNHEGRRDDASLTRSPSNTFLRIATSRTLKFLTPRCRENERGLYSRVSGLGKPDGLSFPILSPFSPCSRRPLFVALSETSFLRSAQACAARLLSKLRRRRE